MVSLRWNFVNKICWLYDLSLFVAVDYKLETMDGLVKPVSSGTLLTTIRLSPFHPLTNLALA